MTAIEAFETPKGEATNSGNIAMHEVIESYKAAVDSPGTKGFDDPKMSKTDNSNFVKAHSWANNADASNRSHQGKARIVPTNVNKT